MISLLMFVSLWICTAKDLSGAKYMHAFFLLLLFATVFVDIKSPHLLPALLLFVIAAVYALCSNWPEYAAQRPRKWKKKWIKNPMEIILFRSFVWLFKLLPLPAVSWIGGRLVETFGPRMKRRQKCVESNLKMIMPENNNPEFIRKMWNNWGRVFAEGLKFSTYVKHKSKYITVKNKELFDTPGQYLLAMPHSGYMGLMSLSFLNTGRRMAVTYKFPSNPLSRNIILKNYGYGQIKELSFIPTGNAFPLMRAIKSGEIININSDQRASLGEVLDFMGHPARTSAGLAQLACKFNLPVLIAHVQRSHGAHHELVFDEFVQMPKTQDLKQDEMTGMQLVNDAFARVIKKNPVEYLWAHRRWES
jgi:KDO2-lipid IV(A) lauroyltransferase